MRKEMGKWLMDVAKYVTTAVLLSSLLGEFPNKWGMYVAGSVTVLLSLSLGLYFIKERRQ
ncbi:DUF6722 family protein [Parabacteroides sp.]